MADISGLSTLAAGEPIDWEKYADAKESAPPPPKGRYVVRVAEQITFGATREGQLSAQIDPTVVGPTSAGTVIRYTRVSAKPFKRGGVTVSQMGDFLRAAGVQTRPQTPQELADAVESAAGRTLQVDIDWEAYDSQTGWRLKGMENFPSDGNGGHQPWVKVPVTGEGEEVRTIRANARVERFVAAS